ncbi:DUF3261 domain-containing protein [Halomonas urmiana]|uniref:DUF3261 domain-containing protein n=2 Tax=Halomonas urmiana TaxID=490901 RepID=A0A5R8MIN1_9GAMM|nr:DUF3261 domain-containing protein [Halomonas urmiana]
MRRVALPRRLGLTLVAGLTLVLDACSMAPTGSPVPTLASLPPAGPETQRLTFVRDGETRVLIGVLRHDSRRLQLALLSPQGQRLLTLVRDAKGARFLPDPAFAPPFSAEWLDTRLSWSLWPAARLEEAFAGSAWSLDQAGEERRIYRGDELVAHLMMTPTCRVIHDVEAAFRLTVAALNGASAAATDVDNKSGNDSADDSYYDDIDTNKDVVTDFDNSIDNKAATDPPCPLT